MARRSRILPPLLVALLAMWLPLGPCCLAMTCMPAAHAQEAPEPSCPVCPTQAEPASAGVLPGSHSDPAAPTPDDPHAPCDCPDELTAAPEPDLLTRGAAEGAGHPLPALDLSIPLPHRLEPAAIGFGRPLDHDVGPPLPPHRSLLAQACLLTI